MSSIIKVNTFQDANGNALFSSDGSGTVTLDSNFSSAIPSAVNTPAFEVYLSGDQQIPHQTFTKVNFNTELFDEGGYYDTSNYRWTPPVGKYMVYANLFTYDNGDSVTMRRGRVVLYKNGSITANPQLQSGWQGNASNTAPDAEMQTFNNHGAVIVNQTTATDYYEIYGYIGNDNGDSNNFIASNGSVFFGYKLIGA
jgi:hypothetical protein